MKKCPFCGAEIEESARFCLYCMESLTEKEQILPPKKKKPQWSLIIAAIAAAVLLLAILLPDGRTEDTSQPSQTVPSVKPTESTGASAPSSQPATQDAAQPSGQATSPETLPTQATSPTTQATTQPTQPSTAPTQPTTAPVTHPTTQPTTASPTEPVHTHSFLRQDTAEKYKKSEATCLAPAQYYFSCACGQQGSDFFSYGEKGSHTIVADLEIPAGCLTPGWTEGYHCAVCELVTVPQQEIAPAGHIYPEQDFGMPVICPRCEQFIESPSPPTLSIKKPALPAVQYGRFQVTGCTYRSEYNGDGTYDIVVTLTFTNISSSTYVSGVWITLSGLEPSDGTSPELDPGETGTCTVYFYTVPAGEYTIIIA